MPTIFHTINNPSAAGRARAWVDLEAMRQAGMDQQAQEAYANARRSSAPPPPPVPTKRSLGPKVGETTAVYEGRSIKVEIYAGFIYS